MTLRINVLPTFRATNQFYVIPNYKNYQEDNKIKLSHDKYDSNRDYTGLKSY